MWKLFFFILFPCASFSVTTKDFLNLLNQNKKNEIQNAVEHLLISTEMGYVLYGNKPACMLELFNDYLLPHYDCQNTKTAIFLKIFSEFMRDLALEYKGNFVLKVSDVCLFGLGPEVLFINRKNFIQVVNKNISLFQYILGPEVTAEKLLEQLLKKNETLFSVLKQNFALVGIILGYGTQNSLFYNRHFILTSSMENTDRIPLRRKEQCLGATEERPNYPGFGHTSFLEELEYLNRKMIPSRALERGAYPPLVIFGYVENEESSQILSAFRVARNKIRQALDGDFLEEVLARFCDDFPDPVQLPKTASQKIDEVLLLDVLSYKFNKQCKNDPEYHDQKWKESFFEGLESKVMPLLPEKSMQLHREEYQARMAYRACQNLKKTEAFFEKLQDQSDLICLVPKKLYFKVIRESKEGFEIDEKMKVSISYRIEDFSDDSASGCFEKMAVHDFVLGIVMGIKGMRIGEVRDLWVHPEYIYGDQGAEPCLGFKVRIELHDAEIGSEQICHSKICSTPSFSENLLLSRYHELKRQCAFDYGCNVGALLGQGIDLSQVSNALKRDAEVQDKLANEVLEQFYVRLLAKQYDTEVSEALNFFSTQSRSAKCISKNRLYLDLITEGKGPRIEKDAVIKVRRVVKNRLGLVLSDSDTSIDLKNTIKGYKLGFEGQKVGSKLKLYVHPDWAYKGFSAYYGDTFLITEAEILALE